MLALAPVVPRARCAMALYVTAKSGVQVAIARAEMCMWVDERRTCSALHRARVLFVCFAYRVSGKTLLLKSPLALRKGP